MLINLWCFRLKNMTLIAFLTSSAWDKWTQRGLSCVKTNDFGHLTSSNLVKRTIHVFILACNVFKIVKVYIYWRCYHQSGAFRFTLLYAQCYPRSHKYICLSFLDNGRSISRNMRIFLSNLCKKNYINPSNDNISGVI